MTNIGIGKEKGFAEMAAHIGEAKELSSTGAAIKEYQECTIEPAPQVIDQMAQLTDGLGRLHSAIGRLEKRIGSVLRPVDEIEGVAEVQKPLVVLAESLRSHVADVSHACHRLESMVRRCEL